MSGQIKEMFVDFNSIVKKGQVIARINPALFEAQVTDGQSSEMVGEALTEGQRVIIGTGNAEQAGSPSGSPRLRLYGLRARDVTMTSLASIPIVA